MKGLLLSRLAQYLRTEHGTSQATRTSSSCIRPCLQVQVPPPVPSRYVTTARVTGEVPRIPNAQVTCRPGAPSPAHGTPGEPHSAPGASAKAEICSRGMVCKPQAAVTSGLPWHIHQHFLQGEMPAGADICHPTTTTSVSSYIIYFTPLCSLPCLPPEFRCLLVTDSLPSSKSHRHFLPRFSFHIQVTSQFCKSGLTVSITWCTIHKGNASTTASCSSQLAALRASPRSPGLGTDHVLCCSTELRASTHSHSSCLTHGVLKTYTKDLEYGLRNLIAFLQHAPQPEMICGPSQASHGCLSHSFSLIARDGATFHP